MFPSDPAKNKPIGAPGWRFLERRSDAAMIRDDPPPLPDLDLFQTGAPGDGPGQLTYRSVTIPSHCQSRTFCR
jgi:hypothetical protein